MKNLHFSKREDELNEVIAKLSFPNQAWFTLRHACELKGINLKTANNRRALQPNGGIAEGLIGGRRCFKRETVLRWVLKNDEEIIGEKENGRI